MLKKIEIRKELFWDVDFSLLSEEKNRKLIIERAITFGNFKELQSILEYYGKQKVIETITSLNYLDPKTLHFFSLVFNVPESNFKCYIKKQSTNQHWTY